MYIQLTLDGLNILSAGVVPSVISSGKYVLSSLVDIENNTINVVFSDNHSELIGIDVFMLNLHLFNAVIESGNYFTITCSKSSLSELDNRNISALDANIPLAFSRANTVVNLGRL